MRRTMICGGCWLALAAIACHDESSATHCPTRSLELRPAEPGTVSSNAYQCTGSAIRTVPCESPLPPVMRQPRCDASPLPLGKGQPLAFSGTNVVLYLQFEGDTLIGARAQTEYFTDVVDSDPPRPEQLEGWLVPDVASPDPDGRNAGRVHLVFADGEIDGRYDTHGPVLANVAAVLSAIDVADAAADAGAVSLDLDSDPQGLPDNALGAFLAELPGDRQARADAKVAAGELLQVVSLAETVNPDAWPNTNAAFYLAVDADAPPDPSNDFSGDGSIAIDPNSAFGIFSGPVVAGTFTGHGESSATVRVALVGAGAPAVLELLGNRLELRLDASGVVGGVIAGAIVERDIDDVLIPALHADIAAAIGADCVGTGCTPGSLGAALVGRFDGDGDDAVSLDELRAHPDVREGLAPDLDLIDAATGNYDPGLDGIPDSLSFGFAFSTVPATIVAGGP